MRPIFLAALIRFSVVFGYYFLYLLLQLLSSTYAANTVFDLCLILVIHCVALLNSNAMLNYTEDNASPILGSVVTEISSDVIELNLTSYLDFCIHFLIILTNLAGIPSWISWIISLHSVFFIIGSNRLV